MLHVQILLEECGVIQKRNDLSFGPENFFFGYFFIWRVTRVMPLLTLMKNLIFECFAKLPLSSKLVNEMRSKVICCRIEKTQLLHLVCDH